MNSYKVFIGNTPSPPDMADLICNELSLQPGVYKREEIINLLSKEKERLVREFEIWKEAVKALKVVPNMGYFKGKDFIKLFDVERTVQTDTDRAKVISYTITGKEIENYISISRKKGKNFVLKFVSPRTIFQVVSVWSFYENIIRMLDKNINLLRKMEGDVTVENKNPQGRSGEQHNQTDNKSAPQAE